MGFQRATSHFPQELALLAGDLSTIVLGETERLVVLPVPVLPLVLHRLAADGAGHGFPPLALAIAARTWDSNSGVQQPGPLS